MKSLLTLLAICTFTTPAVFAAGPADSTPDHELPVRTYEVTVTNITRGQSFTPLIAVTHARRISLFSLGEAPSQELADIAEGGDTSGLQELLEGMPDYVMDIQGSGDGLIGPGESRTMILDSDIHFNQLSLAGMLLPTNDTFVAVNSLRLPNQRNAVYALAYDAGSEENDELCANIPGPTCSGAPFSEGLAEGYVHISTGIHGEGDLGSDAYDWRNPVAMVSVKRISDQ